MWETRTWFFLIKKECEFIKMDTWKKLLLMKKTFISKRQSLLKLIIFIVTMIFIIFKFPASKSSIIGNYSTQKAPLRDDWIQPILIWKYSVTTLRGFNQKFKMRPQTFEYSLNMIPPGIEKMWFFNWDCLSYYRSLWNSLICFIFVLQF